jgi:cytochrome c556
MSRFFVYSILSICFVSSAAMAGGDPIEKRQKLMEETRDAAKVIGGMLKEEKPFDAEAAMNSLKVWEKTAAKAGDLFPEGSETGHDTEAKAEIWTDRDGFNERMADFSTKVDAAIAANPESLEVLGKVAGPIFKSCKACHEGYRVEKED